MYNVLLVDDEREIRQGLKLKVDWEQLSLRVEGEAANGKEAIDQVMTGHYDIVITDMNMPLMDGVSLLQYCFEYVPSVRIIVITGYNDFQYAQAAIKNNVCDLILKPIARNELVAALSKVVKELEVERTMKARQEMTERKLSTLLEDMKDQYIAGVIKAYSDEDRQLRERAKMFKLETLERESVRFITVGLTEGEEDGNFQLPFELLCRELAQSFQTEVTLFREASRPSLMHFILRDEPVVVRNFVNQIQTATRKYLKKETMIGIGQVVRGLEEWREGYLSSILSWTKKGIEDTLSQANSAQSLLPQETVKFLMQHLVEGREEEFERLAIKELAKGFEQSPIHFVKLIFQLLLLIETAAQSLGITLDGKQQLWIKPEWVWEMITVEKACDYLFRLSSSIFNHRLKQGDNAECSVISSIKETISRNYMYELNLSTFAKQYHYNPTYLSELFKMKTGKTFMQYSTDVRISKALQLLDETQLSHSDIAELTGFSNASYFSTKFKKRFGVSPSEYRQNKNRKS